jgi:hypothetical protein
VDADAVIYWDNGRMAGDELQENDTEAVDVALLAYLVTAVIPA